MTKKGQKYPETCLQSVKTNKDGPKRGNIPEWRGQKRETNKAD